MHNRRDAAQGLFVDKLAWRGTQIASLQQASSRTSSSVSGSVLGCAIRPTGAWLGIDRSIMKLISLGVSVSIRFPPECEEVPTRTTERKTPQKVSTLTLVGIVVGSMVGGGVFTLPRSFGSATGVLGAIIAWIIAGTGMLMLAFVFQSLAVRRPDLDSGVYIYAKTGFGNFAGFNAAFGYWASNVAGNVFFLVFTMTTLGSFFPGLGEGNTLLAVGLASACVWLFHYLIARGVRQAAAVNWIVTVAKLVPIVGSSSSSASRPTLRRSRPTSGAVRRDPCAPCSIRSRTRCWSRLSCSSESKAPACTPGSHGAVRTSDARPCSASSACWRSSHR
jgi:Amino acid permease